MRMIDKIFSTIPLKTLFNIVLFISFFVFYLLTPPSSNKIILDLQELLKASGILIIILIIPFALMVSPPKKLSIKKHVTLIFNTILKVFIILVISNALLVEPGEKVLDFFTKHPESQFLSIFALAIFIFLAKTISNVINTSNQEAYDDLKIGSISQTSKPVNRRVSRDMTEEDISLVAAHETGHLLLNYLYGKFPDDFRAEIFLNSSDNISGMVSNIYNKNTMGYKNYELWRMYVLLSGQLGETILLGINSNGSGADYAQWQELAIIHLNNQFGGLYYVNPKTELEIQHNSQMLNNLKTLQTENILKFMDSNKLVMEELYEELKSKKLLLTKDIEIHFNKIIFLENMPYPNGTDFINSYS